jgi:hypothetical protein
MLEYFVWDLPVWEAFWDLSLDVPFRLRPLSSLLSQWFSGTAMLFRDYGLRSVAWQRVFSMVASLF